jgi:hypothetical protein
VDSGGQRIWGAGNHSARKKERKNKKRDGPQVHYKSHNLSRSHLRAGRDVSTPFENHIWIRAGKSD